MIILDTNVLSGVIAVAPRREIVDWLDRQVGAELFTTVITYYESWNGIARLEPGRRRAGLEAAFWRAMGTVLKDRILPLDTRAAHEAAVLSAARFRTGRPVEARDTLIAGIVLAQNATLATGNIRHFADANIPLINPWEA